MDFRKCDDSYHYAITPPLIVSRYPWQQKELGFTAYDQHLGRPGQDQTAHSARGVHRPLGHPASHSIIPR